MSPLSIAILVAAYLFILFALMAAPVGRRTVTASVDIAAPRDRIWAAVWPLGADASWSGKILACAATGADTARMKLDWDDRDGQPIERTVRFEDVEPGKGYALTVVDDTSLAQKFWRSYREEVELADIDGGVRVTFLQKDSYRGLAFPIFRWFVMRRDARKLKIWAETGKFTPGGVIEHPLTQVGFAFLSVLLLWPLFGMTKSGLVLSVALTVVVAAHELGHMAAFRVMGHRTARMIFIPLIGGVAIGGRPYDSRFEVAFSALMGAGFSAFLVPLAMAGGEVATRTGQPEIAGAMVAFIACATLFNLANLLPVGRFDGGQVLRQVLNGTLSLGLTSFVMLFAFLGLGWLAGLPSQMLIIGGAVLAILSLATAGHGVKPKKALKPITLHERWAAGGGLAATFVVHAIGALWTAERFLGL